MKSTYITLDDNRVTFKSSRPGRVYSLEGKDQSPEYPYPHTVFSNGYHVEPRMSSVSAPPKSFNLNPGDYAKVQIEDTPLIGVVLELADHHYDFDLQIDGIDIFQGFSCVSSYLPSSDGFGKIHWLLMDRDKHELTLRVSSQYNRMLEASNIQPSHACMSGFILSNEINFPPPIYQNWMYTQQSLQPDTRGRKSSFSQNIIPAGGTFYLMDLPGRGSLQTLVFDVDHPIDLEIMDGGAAQPEYPHDFPSWIRQVNIGQTNSGAFNSVTNVTELPGKQGFRILMTKPVHFASRLIIRLKNNDKIDHVINNMYMEGTYQCM